MENIYVIIFNYFRLGQGFFSVIFGGVGIIGVCCFGVIPV